MADPGNQRPLIGKAIATLAMTLLAVVGWPAATSAQGKCLDFVSGCATTTDSGVGWHYSAAEQAFVRTPTSIAARPTGPKRQWTYVPACDGNTPGGNADACQGALCTAPGGEPGVTFRVFSRPIVPADSAWDLAGSQCIPGEQRVDLADLEAEVRRIVEDRFREITQPTLHLAPQAGGLVNLPVLAWTDDPGPVTLDFQQPLPGTIVATPTYAWTWSNGSQSSGPGRPYTPELSPSRTPDHYVHGVYGTRGEGWVELTVTWQGDVTVPGLPSIDIAPLVYTATTSFAVREARAQLVDAYG